MDHSDLLKLLIKTSLQFQRGMITQLEMEAQMLRHITQFTLEQDKESN